MKTERERGASSIVARRFAAAVLVAVVGVQLGLGGPAWAAKNVTRREAYVGGTADSFANFCRTDTERGNLSGKNIGRVCFTGLTGRGVYKLTVVDASGLDVGFTYTWNDETYRSGCKTITFRRPGLLTELKVFLDGPIGQGGWLPGCLQSRSSSRPGFATSGTVTLTKLSVRRKGGRH